MNINMLRDADNDAGFNAALCNANPLLAWAGATIYRSSDGSTYTALASAANETTMGATFSKLGDFRSGNIPDEMNQVVVRLAQGTLSSTDNAGLLDGVNTCIIGEEILSFRSAVLGADGFSYTLSGLLRGRRGSEYAMSTHVLSERFIMVEFANLVRIAQTTADIGISRYYKPVCVGGVVADATSQLFTNEGTGLKPYAPVLLGGGRNAAGDIILVWTRRARMSGEWRNNVDVPLDEATESYDVEILNTNIATGSIVAGADSLVYLRPTLSVNIADHGAVFGGVTDNLTAINAAIAAAVAAGHKTVWVPAGTWAYDGEIQLWDGVVLTGAGQTSILHALDWSHRAIWLGGIGGNTELSNLKMTVAGVMSRQSSWPYCAIVAGGDRGATTNWIVSNVFIEGGGGAGIYSAAGSSYGLISHCTVRNTLADSIHNEGTTHHITVKYNFTENSGDDGIAAVTYAGATGYTNNIVAYNNHVKNNVGGRGMSMVGTQDCHYYNNYIEGVPDYAGIYVAQESGYTTKGNFNGVIEYNTIVDCGSVATGHAAIMVYSDGGEDNDNISFLRNDIVQTGTQDGIRYYGPQTNIALDQNRFTDCANDYVGGVDPDVTITAYTGGLIGQTPEAAGLRTFSGLISPTVTYTAAQQIADFGSLQPTVNFRAFQLSAVVGRGHPALGVI